MIPATRYGLLVKDVKILACQQGANWWLTFRRRFEPTGRVIAIDGTATPQGDWAWVRCGDPDDGSDSKEHASWLRQHMIDNGVPASALAIRPEPSEFTYIAFKKPSRSAKAPAGE